MTSQLISGLQAAKAMVQNEKQELNEISRWFAERGFKLHLIREEDDLVWAELGRLPSGRIVAPMYGRGDTEIAAARRAKERFGQEQWLAAEAIPEADAAIVEEAQAILGSDELDVLRASHAAGTAAEVDIGGTTVVYAPEYTGSGMTLFGENGFVLGQHAFSSEEELAKTLLQESYRLGMSNVPSIGANGDLVSKETDAAFNFAERYYQRLTGENP